MFTNKVFVVTGGGGILCSTLCSSFSETGARVAVLDLNKETADNVAKRIIEKGGVPKGYQTNVLKKENIETLQKQVYNDLGPYET